MKIFDQKPSIVTFLGDIHGNMKVLLEICEAKTNPIIQVGDFGFGFVDVPSLPEHVRMIRGNHDDPSLCKEHPNWIPDGHIENNMMFIGGAESIDKMDRLDRMNDTGVPEWWIDEQLSDDELSDLVDVAYENKPSIIVSHDCPSFLLDSILYGKAQSRTSQALNVIWKIAPPKVWVFGHYHRSIKTKIDGTLFICCTIDEAVDIDLSGF